MVCLVFFFKTDISILAITFFFIALRDNGSDKEIERGGVLETTKKRERNTDTDRARDRMRDRHTDWE